MPLRQQDRISFSKSIIDAEKEKAAIDRSQVPLLANRQAKFNLDEGNRRLQESKTFLIDPYQNELGRYNGIFRLTLAEIDMSNSANFVLGNPLFPNDPQNPPPSTAPLIWTKPKPFANSKAVGKQNNEAYPVAVTAEQSYTTTILSSIATIESFPLIQRVTGQQCSNTPVLNTIAPNVAIQSVFNTMFTAVNDLKSYVLTTQSEIFASDPDIARQTQNNAAMNDINNIVTAIDNWLALVDFNTAHGQSTCTGFNSYNPALLGSTKLQSGDLATFKTAILTRQAFVSNRVAQIDGHLGSLSQDLNTGDVTGSGFYFERWRFILLRLSLFGGSLIGLKSIDRSLNAQNDLKAQADLVKSVYSELLTCVVLSAPTNGTKNIHLKDIGDLVAGDDVFLVSDTQFEIKIRIASVDVNKIMVSTEIPPKYRPDEGARLYKDKS